MARPDFVVVGHAVRDIVPGGWRLGGTVTFAAVQAHRLGLSVGVVTASGPDFDVQAQLPFAKVITAPSTTTTEFENVYVDGQRRQRVPSRADAITADAIPDDWTSAPIVLLGPVLEDLPPDLRRRFAWDILCGVSAQGWLRRVGADGHVEHAPWTGAPFWERCDVLFVSDEDLAGDDSMLERWTREVPIVAMTESWKGARVFGDGDWRRIDAFPEAELDPTGAGDTFATAFLVRLRESGDVHDAARFGAAAASISVGGVAAESIPTRAEIEERLRAYPEVALR
jgi:sugar/nucleoside kinase (ribokinase family)